MIDVRDDGDVTNLIARDRISGPFRRCIVEKTRVTLRQSMIRADKGVPGGGRLEGSTRSPARALAPVCASFARKYSPLSPSPSRARASRARSRARASGRTFGDGGGPSGRTARDGGAARGARGARARRRGDGGLKRRVSDHGGGVRRPMRVRRAVRRRVRRERETSPKSVRLSRGRRRRESEANRASRETMRGATGGD